MVNNSVAFLEAMRAAEWSKVAAWIRGGKVDLSIPTPSESIIPWLIELDAPAHIVLLLLRSLISRGAPHPNETVEGNLWPDRTGLLWTCLNFSITRAYASLTFEALLRFGLSPNVVDWDTGETVFQKAVRLNRVREVRALLRHGVDPHQVNVAGLVRSTNLNKATQTGNQAAQLALEKWVPSTGG